MKEIKDELEQQVTKAVKTLTKEEFPVKLLPSASLEHGDFTTNVALAGAKVAKMPPRDFAQKVITELEKTKNPQIERFEIAGPGFINIWLKHNFFISNVNRLLDSNEKPAIKAKSQKVMLEFADPNPFKEFHIGHLRNITLGESYARLLEATGNDVWRVNYQGDVGMHVAKALYGMNKLQDEMSSDESSTAQKAAFLGKAYATGAAAFESDESARQEIQKINQQVYAKDPEIMPLWEKGKAWSLEYFETIYARVGTKYKRYYFESEVSKKGKELVLAHIDDGIFEKDQGAVVFKKGPHTRVFVTSQGYPTYEAKDLALASIKYQDFSYDKSIIITAYEQDEYFKVLLSAMKLVEPELAAKTVHDSFGFVSLKEGKMSSRTGNVVTGQWLLDEAKQRILTAYPSLEDTTAEQVAVGAVKYSMLRFAKGSDISFSFDESISLEGNSGPYLQYTFARTQSVLAKAQNSNFKTQNLVEENLDGYNFNKEEVAVFRKISQYELAILDASEKFAPNLLANYLFELAQLYNNFYQKHQIITNNDNEKTLRLLLTISSGIVIKDGLTLLGIEAPEKM